MVIRDPRLSCLVSSKEEFNAHALNHLVVGEFPLSYPLVN